MIFEKLSIYTRKFAISAAIVVLPISAQAQAVEAALAEARVRLACGSGTPVSAVYLPNGSIEVTCRQNVPQRAATNTAAAETARTNPLGGTTLTAGPVGGTIAAAVVLGVVVGGSDGSTTTTSTASE